MISRQQTLPAKKKKKKVVNILLTLCPLCDLANNCSKSLVNPPTVSFFLALFFLTFFCPLLFLPLHFFGTPSTYFYSFIPPPFFMIWKHFQVSAQEMARGIIIIFIIFIIYANALLFCILTTISTTCSSSFYLLFHRFFRTWHININDKSKIEYLLTFF